MAIHARFHFQRDLFSLNLDISCPDKGITAIFGPSGCGKTTLLRLIAGLEPERNGYLKVGDNVWQKPGYSLPPHQRPLGFVFQENNLFVHLNVQRNLEYGLKRLKNGDKKVSLKQVVEFLQIGHLLHRQTYQLSGGEKKRVAIARALAVNPAMLLLDEPMAGLDQQRKLEILPYLESLHREMDIPVLYVSHSRNEVARLADHMVLLQNGQVQAQGTVHELFSRFDLSLAHGPETQTVIDATVVEHDKTFDLTYMEFSGGRFSVAHRELSVGSRVRLQVFARDVSLTLDHPSNTSILNIFPAIVEKIVEEGTAQVTVQLRLGSEFLLSRITRKSSVELNLQPGIPVFVQIKSVAVIV